MFNEFDLPVDGKVQYRKDRDGSKRFDAEIAKTFDGERGNITPSARYSTQSSSRSMGDVVIDDDGRQIGFAIEGELYLDPDSENKLRGAIDIENSRQKRSFTFPEGQFVKTENGVLKKFNLGADLGILGLDATYTDDSRKGTRAQGSATIKIGENGIVRYEDSSDGKPQFSAKYSTELGEGSGSFNYKDDSRNVPEYGAELNTSIGEGLGSLSYSTGGKGDRFGVGYTLNFASGGEAMGPPPTRGPDPQGIGYFQQFANGGDVVGKKTGEQTSVGRDVYLTPDGERVSEKSLTFEVDGIFVNVPSIQDGIRYSSDQVYEMMMNGEIQPTSAHKTEEEAISAAKARSDSLIKKFADGGPVYMKEGGEVITPDDIAGMREKIMNDYGFDPEDVAVQEGVPPELFLRLLFKENRGRQGPKSPKGAVGLAQLMPATAKELGVDPTVPYENAVGGARYLKQKIAEFDGDVLLGLAAYNAGAGNVRKYEGVPPFAETQDYVAVILGEGYSGGTSLSETIRKEQGFAPSMSYEGQENDVREEQGLVPISMASSGTSEGVGSLMRQESSAPKTSLRPVLRPTAPSTSLRPVLRPEETSAPETSLRPVLRGQDQTLREKYAPENFERNLLSPDAFQYLNGLGVMEREGKKQGIETLDPRGIRRINNFAMERSTMA